MGPTELAARLAERFPAQAMARDELTVVIDREELLEALAYLSGEADLGFSWLSDLSATDWPGRDPRFLVAYHLYSLEHGHRLRVKVGVPEDDPRLPSVVKRYPAADWMEREVFDMYGVRFDGHPNLVRILMPDDWEGHPLRKDYPVGRVPVQFKAAPSTR